MKTSVVILTLSLLCIVLIHSSAGFTSGAGRNAWQCEDLPDEGLKEKCQEERDKGDVKMLSEIIGKIMEQALDLPRKDEDEDEDEVKVEDEVEDKDVFDEMIFDGMVM